MKGKRKTLVAWIVGALVVTWVGFQSVAAAVRFVNKRNATNQAQTWLDQAQQDVKPGTTKAMVVRWLKQNGAEMVGEGYQVEINAQEKEHPGVVGFSSIAKGDSPTLS